VIKSASQKLVIVFDLDDTLYPEHEFVASGFQAVDEELGRRGIHGFLPVARKLFDEGLRGTIFDAALIQLDVPFTPELIAELVETYRSHVPQLQLFPDASWALNRYASTTLGLLTDGISRTQRNKVLALGLMTRFAATIFTDELGPGLRKPSLVPFQRISAHLEVQPETHRLVYVADNPKKDFVAPNQLGWMTIRIQRGIGEYCKLDPIDQRHAPQHEINTLEELPQVLDL
jgi:putative hydrolase of the HAD superfamily